MRLCLTILLVLSSVNVYSKELPESISADVRDLVELIPCNLIATLFMEYVAVDVQLHKILYYITTDHFHKNLVMFETSEAFNETQDYLKPLGIDLFKGIEVLHNLIDTAQEQRLRKRSPGDGLFGLIKEASYLIPLEEMKDLYNVKVNENPDFQKLMENLLTPELRNHISDMMNTNQFEEIVHALTSINVPVGEIIDYIEEKLIYFFDLDSKEVD